MPYISKDARSRLSNGGRPVQPGELNYVIAKTVDDYLRQKGRLGYAHINEVVGVLECLKLELYRRVADHTRISRSKSPERFSISSGPSSPPALLAPMPSGKPLADGRLT